jgi:hypothetical protein
MDEKYEGWQNRETWAANLWMENNSKVYNYVFEKVKQVIAVSKGSEQLRVEDFIKQFLEEAQEKVENREAQPDTVAAIVNIGSFWRINYPELAGHWIAKARSI